MGKEMVMKLWQRMVPILASISVEPVFLLDGFAFSNMVVLVESLQFDKICKVNLNFTEEICDNFENYRGEERLYNAKVSSFKRNDGAITSIIPLFFILFIGAWSDKYGRKVPLCFTLVCHILFSAGYLLNALWFNLSVDFLLVVGFLDSIGGGAVAFLTVANAYISDVTTTEQRTSRVALANSLWFLGGPLGTLIGTTIYKNAGYAAVFTTSLVLYIVAFGYVILLLPESHGPFSDKEKLRKISKPKPTLRLSDTILRVYGMSKKKKTKLGKTESEEERELRKSLTWRKLFVDFFDIKRVLNSFRCVFKKREGFIRFFIFMLVLSNFLRKIGRGAYAFYFTKEVLKWRATDYGYWSTYKNIISTMGSLLAVPILSTKLKVSDNSLAMIGSVSSIMDYILYGLVTSSTFFLMWVAPAASILVNSCSIAMRSMMSKYVSPEELGQVSAVTGTVEGVVPIISTTLYSAITKNTFETFPGAQYFFGASCNILMALIFVLIMALDKSDDYDLEAAEPKQTRPKGPVIEKAIVIRKDSKWLFDETNKKIRLATILLTALNFSIEVPNIEKTYSKKNKKLSTINELGEDVEELDAICENHHRRNENVPVTEIATLDITEAVQINGISHQVSKEGEDNSGTRLTENGFTNVQTSENHLQQNVTRNPPQEELSRNVSTASIEGKEDERLEKIELTDDDENKQIEKKSGNELKIVDRKKPTKESTKLTNENTQTHSANQIDENDASIHLEPNSKTTESENDSRMTNSKEQPTSERFENRCTTPNEANTSTKEPEDNKEKKEQVETAADLNSQEKQEHKLPSEKPVGSQINEEHSKEKTDDKNKEIENNEIVKEPIESDNPENKCKAEEQTSKQNKKGSNENIKEEIVQDQSIIQKQNSNSGPTPEPSPSETKPADAVRENSVEERNQSDVGVQQGTPTEQTEGDSKKEETIINSEEHKKSEMEKQRAYDNQAFQEDVNI